MAIQLLGFPTTLGLPRAVSALGPSALRAAGLVAALADLGQAVADCGEMALPAGQPADPVEVRVRKVVEAARRQRDHWLQAHRDGDLLLTVGGDHSTSLGTIWALSAMGHRFDVVWIDAHADFNTVETSPSGNPHGMVLAMATGLFPQLVPPLVSPERLHLWGVRDLDPGERALLERHGVQVLGPGQVRQEWDRLIDRLGPDVFLSFDVDSVEPAEAPGTMTPVPGGFRRQEALDLVAAVARKRRLLAVDIVEYYPERDRGTMTAELLLNVVRAAVSGKAPRAAGVVDAAAGN